MFYSHEVLTSRKYGVATVWLVATVASGARVSSKRVSRKAILEVDIPKACETIVEPAAPLALRLQSTLLYGVARVYGQQCGYILADVESARNDMYTLRKALRTSALAAEGDNIGRADQLVLRDDPDFDPNLYFQLDDLDILGGSDVYGKESYATTMLESAENSVISDGHNGSSKLDSFSLHSQSTPRSLLGRHLMAPEMMAGSSIRMSQPGHVEYQGLQEEDLGLDLGFDADDGVAPAFASTPRQDHRVAAGDEILAVPEASIEGASVGDIAADMHVDYGMEPDDKYTHSGQNIVRPEFDSNQQIEEAITSTTASAPLQVKKMLPIDNNTQLHSRNLKEWMQNYLVLQAKQRHQKELPLARRLAKENARMWFYGASTALPNPLAAFNNQAVLRRVEETRGRSSRKRARAQDGEDDARRVRDRQASVAAYYAQDYDTATPDYPDIEVGREEATPLPDRQSVLQLPWSQGASSRGHGSVNMARPSSSMAGSRLPSLQPQARQRLASTSPRPRQKSQRLGSDIVVPVAPDFEVYGSAGEVDTQTAAESQWLRKTLDNESMEFLAYLGHAIKKRSDVQVGHDDATQQVGFQELLPPAEHTAIVAAQAFYHVLTLSTRGLLVAEQMGVIGGIQLTML